MPGFGVPALVHLLPARWVLGSFEGGRFRPAEVLVDLGQLGVEFVLSLIHTAELNGANAFDYLVALQRYAPQVAATPSDWMPWNYTAARDRLAEKPAANESPPS